MITSPPSQTRHLVKTSSSTSAEVEPSSPVDSAGGAVPSSALTAEAKQAIEQLIHHVTADAHVSANAKNVIAGNHMDVGE